MNKQITKEQYNSLQYAYDFFNKALFNGNLPHVLVTLQRTPKSRGYFAANRFHSFQDAHFGEMYAGELKGVYSGELALNPDAFVGRTEKEILSTLVHEMVHVWQDHNGTAPKWAYHNREWADKMKELGLQPTSTGEPDGKETGKKMTHYIVACGAYSKAYDRLLSEFKRSKISGVIAISGAEIIQWQSTEQTKEKKASKNSKTKFTCPDCEQNAWAKPDAELMCGVCTIPLEIQV